MVSLRIVPTDLCYSCVLDIISALHFTGGFSDCSCDSNDGSGSSYQNTGDGDISDYNWRTHSLALPKKKRSEFNSNIDLGSKRCCLWYNDCNHYGVPCALAIKRLLLVFKLLESNITIYCSSKRTLPATELKKHIGSSEGWYAWPSRRALLQVS